MSRRGRSRARALAPLLLALGCSSCLTARWQRQKENEPVTLEAAGLAVGEATLTESLDALGAPLFVWEQPEGSFALAYGWTSQRGLGATVTLPTSRVWSPSYSYDDIDDNLYGAVLIFDRETALRVVRQGYLREIAAELRRQRPADLDFLGPELGPKGSE